MNRVGFERAGAASFSKMKMSKIDHSPQRVRIVAVIVLYKMSAGESPTVRTLFEAAWEATRSDIDLELAILIQDNTPGGQDAGEVPSGVRYRSTPDNPGLASAYNWALEIAAAEDYGWLLTLDQDTSLPANFLSRVGELAASLDASTEIAAIVPQITGSGRNLSPFHLALGAIPRWYPYGFTGIISGAYALNSAATLRVGAIREVGGYDPMFPLDCSDISLFHRLHLAGKRMMLAGDLLVTHDFSMLEKQNRMSIERYRSLLLDECAFYDIHMSPLARGERLFRLSGRVFKDLLTSEKRAFCSVTLGELIRRLVTPRARRVDEWRRKAKSRKDMAQALHADPALDSRAKDSKSHT
jgi:GT2 family glycosyltransferase